MIYGVLEIEILSSVWDMQERDEDANISVSDVVNALNNNEVNRAYTTVKTVMDRLVAKGILVRYKNNKKFFYRTTIDRDEAAKSAIEAVAGQFFENNYVKMLRFVEKECEHLLV